MSDLRSWEVAPSTIIWEDRLRDDFGDIDALAQSIDEHGLLHPVTVQWDGDRCLGVAGHRRCLAVLQLGLDTIAARSVEDLSEAERRLLELEENVHRKDLTPTERSRVYVEIKRVTKEVVEEEEPEEVSPHRGAKPRSGPKGGRPTGATSSRSIAERSGVPAETTRRAEQHLSAVARFPFLDHPEVPAKAATHFVKQVDEHLPDCDDLLYELLRARNEIDILRDHKELRAITHRLIAIGEAGREFVRKRLDGSHEGQTAARSLMLDRPGLDPFKATVWARRALEHLHTGVVAEQDQAHDLGRHDYSATFDGALRATETLIKELDRREKREAKKQRDAFEKECAK